MVEYWDSIGITLSTPISTAFSKKKLNLFLPINDCTKVISKLSLTSFSVILSKISTSTELLLISVITPRYIASYVSISTKLSIFNLN